ncbi:MAG: hypothetical protein ABI180_00265 [Microcoleus sp.]|jgi:hypothetical protein
MTPESLILGGLCRLSDGDFTLSASAVIWIRDWQVEMLVEKLIVL